VGKQSITLSVSVAGAHRHDKNYKRELSIPLFQRLSQEEKFRSFVGYGSDFSRYQRVWLKNIYTALFQKPGVEKCSVVGLFWHVSITKVLVWIIAPQQLNIG
jgi:hypothetical protein